MTSYLTILLANKVLLPAHPAVVKVVLPQVVKAKVLPMVVQKVVPKVAK